MLGEQGRSGDEEILRGWKPNWRPQSGSPHPAGSAMGARPRCWEKLGVNEAAGRDAPVAGLAAYRIPKQGWASPMQPKTRQFAAKVGMVAPTRFGAMAIRKPSRAPASRSSPPARWPPSMRCRRNTCPAASKGILGNWRASPAGSTGNGGSSVAGAGECPAQGPKTRPGSS